MPTSYGQFIDIRILQGSYNIFIITKVMLSGTTMNVLVDSDILFYCNFLPSRGIAVSSEHKL